MTERVQAEAFLRKTMNVKAYAVKLNHNKEIELTVWDVEDNEMKYLGPDPQYTNYEEYLKFLGYLSEVPEFRYVVYRTMAEKIRQFMTSSRSYLFNG